MLSFQILLSCMNEKDFSVLANSNINSNTIIVNQCNENGIEQIKDKVIMFNVAENGLSRSRNLAISKSNKDICLLADDDEFFYDNLEEIILNTYKNCPKADIIIFEFENKRKNLSKNIRKLYFFEMLKISSVQISFKRNSIQEKNIKFDTLLGAGTGNGAGEENKFLIDCYKSGLKIYYAPIDIGYLRDDKESTWFRGYNEDYFYKRGKATRYYLGIFLATIYGIYFILFKNKIYSDFITRKKAFLFLMKGIYATRLGS
ncbi:glycosyltransferase family A protein [Turicibacter sanguinis]|uniref:glycosyltransferase family A protein n=1 Tax=Turicibacter sanguinis TaxID=154288 RepID=UPI0018AAE0F0|nr:glycosyltransferase family A protein [Turicibacter sanguinis]